MKKQNTAWRNETITRKQLRPGDVLPRYQGCGNVEPWAEVVGHPQQAQARGYVVVDTRVFGSTTVMYNGAGGHGSDRIDVLREVR